MIPKILLLDPLPMEGVKAFEEFANITNGVSYTNEQLYGEINQYDALVIRSNNYISGKLIRKATKLKLIGRAGSGLDNIDGEEAKKRNVLVITSPEGNVCSVAEYTIGMMIFLCHKLMESHNGSRSNDFRRHTWQGRNLKNLTVGIIGLGNIGVGVVQKLSPLCDLILGYDPFYDLKRKNTISNFKVLTELKELLMNSDIISLHLPLNQETQAMLNKETFKLVKKGCILINTSRGRLIDDEALLLAFKNGTIASAALDCLYPDPNYNQCPEDSNYSHFLVNHPKVYYTPHIAAYTNDAIVDVACNLANKMKNFFESTKTKF